MEITTARLPLIYYLISLASGQISPIQYDIWRPITPSLPDATNGVCQTIAGYDSADDAIKIYGGEHHPQAQYIFDPQHENYTYSYNAISANITVEFSYEQHGDIIYYATSSEIRGLSMSTGEDQLYGYLDANQTQINPGMCIDATDGTIYLVGNKEIETCIPDINNPTNCTITSQSDLVYAPLAEATELTYQACEVYNNSIFVFGGRDPSGNDVNTIWKCDPITQDSCAALPFRPETQLRAGLAGIHSVKIQCFQHNYVALIGGIANNVFDPTSLIDVFDMDSETILAEFYQIERLLFGGHRGFAAVWDPVIEQIFMFGGIINGGGACTNTIYVTNVTSMGLCVTDDPTMDPTSDPTLDPTVDPTFEPTLDPTIDPTEDPTIDPTIDPTADPTRDPTVEPTDHPSTNPTQIPTDIPTLDGQAGDITTTDADTRITDDDDDGTPWWVWLIIGLAAALCCCLIILAFCMYKRQKEEEEKEEEEKKAAAAKEEDVGLAGIASATTVAVELAETQPDAEDSDNELYGRKNVTTKGSEQPQSDSDIYGKGKKSTKKGAGADGNTMIAQEPDDIFDEDYEIHESDEEVMSDSHEGGKITAGGPNAMNQQVSLEGGGDPAVTGQGHGDPKITKAQQGENDSAPTLGAAPAALEMGNSAEDDIYGKGDNKSSSDDDGDNGDMYKKGKKKTRGKKKKAEESDSGSDSDSDAEVMYDKGKKGPSKGGPKDKNKKKEYVEEDGVVYGDPVVTGGGENNIDLNESGDDEEDEFADDAINV